MFNDDKAYWFPDPDEGYSLGRIVDIGADTVTLSHVSNARNQVTVKYDDVLSAEEYDNYPDDNCGLMFLNEGTLLNNVRQRYLRDKIYTYVANILISVNPYCNIPDLYGSRTMRMYLGASLGKSPPHIYAIADKAYRDMKIYKESQAVIVSGESGAGKTEATKHVLRYLTECYGEKSGNLEQRIVESNPLLEAFGNAKTVRNNNSSRFGKFIEIHFSSRLQVCGGQVAHYLLEKSRVVSQSSPERNYHIFYRLCVGAPAKLRQSLGLSAPEHFNYLRSGCDETTVSYGDDRYRSRRSEPVPSPRGSRSDGVLNDAEDFVYTEKAMVDMCIDDKTRHDIYMVLAAVLHLGNVEFTDEDCKDDGCVIRDESRNALAFAARLMGLHPQDLQKALTTRVATVRQDAVHIAMRMSESVGARDALAKAIYSKLFDFIVRCVNRAIPKSASSHYIGVLDIAGFEYFEKNNFEQFCINYCNEKLQQFFNRRILKDEQELYEREGLGLKKIDFVDNQDCIDLIEKKPGCILDLLDEENRLPTGRSEHFTDEVHAKFRGHTRLDIPRKSKLRSHRSLLNNEGFLIRHFAGAVCYSTANFLEKNNDALHGSLLQALSCSQNPMIQDFVAEMQDESGGVTPRSGANPQRRPVAGKLNFISVGSKFRTQLNSLMEKLYSTGTSFVRCIKPNSSMAPHLFEGLACLSQLQCSGMTDVLSVMEQGFPSRTPFQDLYNMYKSRLSANLARLDPRVFCKLLFKALGLSTTDFRFGTSRVFFRPGKFAEFDEMLQCDPAHLAALIKKVQQWLVRYRWKQAIYCVLEVIKLQRKIEFKRHMYTRIQAQIRGWRTRRRYQPMIQAMLHTRSMQSQLSSIHKAYKQMQTGQTGVQETKELNARVEQFRRDMIRRRILRPDDIRRVLDQLEHEMSEAHAKMKKAAERERAAQEEARRAAEKAERERRRVQEEERQHQLVEEERHEREQLERRRMEEERIARQGANEVARLAAEKDAENRQKARLEYQAELERRDHELALRISNGDANAVEEVNANPTEVSSLNPKYAYLTGWTYPQLRQTINSSCDMELLAACRDEFHRRIKAYQDWKEKKRQEVSSVHQSQRSSGPVRAPRDVLDHAAGEGKLYANSRANGSRRRSRESEAEEQRYFKVALGKGDSPEEGWWYAHFSGRYVVRQMQLSSGHPPALMLTGVHDINMCELPLEETGLTRRKGAEILEREFNQEWGKHGGQLLLKRFAQQLHHPQLKSLLRSL